MAAPNYRGAARYGGATAPSRPDIGRDSGWERRRRSRLERDGRRRESRERRQSARMRRGFVLVVLVPAMLLLGSVYLHNVASDTSGRITVLKERIDEAESRYEQLGVREAELSSPERIRTLAEDDLGMEDANASQIEVVGQQAGNGDGIGAQGDQVEE